MGRFRSLFDADEMSELAIAAGLVETEEVAPAIAESPRRSGLLLDAEAPASAEASLNLQQRSVTAPVADVPATEPLTGEEPVVVGSPESSGARAFSAGDSYPLAGPQRTSESEDSPHAAVQGSPNDSSLRGSGTESSAASTESETTADMAAMRELSAPGIRPALDAATEEREARVRRLLMEYLAGEPVVVPNENRVTADASSTPLPAVVLDSDETSEAPHARSSGDFGQGAGTEGGTRPFLPSQGSAPVAAIETETPEASAPGAEPDVEPVREPTSPRGVVGGGAAVPSFDSSFTPAPPGPADTGIPAFDTPFRASVPNTAVSSAAAPAPLPGQDMLRRLGCPPMYTLLRASLLARVPWRAWQERPWSQTQLCAALATVTGESEQFFSQEGAWRS
jgi:hypothetical protein